MMAVTLYQILLKLFPQGFRDHCARDAGEAFAELCARSSGLPRVWIILRSFGRLPRAAIAEHLYERRQSQSHRAPMKRRSKMEGWIKQFRYALRTLLKSPSFSLSTVLLVALGVGSVTTIFTLVDHLVLRALPYPAADRLVSPEDGAHSGPLFREMEQLPGFDLWGGGFARDANLSADGDPQRLRQAFITNNFFELFGAQAARGRLLDDDDFGGTDRVVISEGAWNRIWGGDPELLGRSIVIDEDPVTVVGILSGNFESPEPIVGKGVDVWRPVDWTAELATSHDFWILEVAGRMEPGVTLADTQSQMDLLMGRMASLSENYRLRDSDEARLLPVVPLTERVAGDLKAGLGLLFGAVGLLLLVACANVAHLFLARGLSRQREMAVRRALGANTRTLVGQLMAESLMVGLAGGILALVLAQLGLRTFLAFSPYELPRSVPMTIDLRVLGFAALLAILTAIAFGLFPALRSVGQDPGDALKGGSRTATSGRGANTIRSGLLVAEIALSLVLITSAGLLLRSFFQVQGQDPGFEMQSVWTLPLSPTTSDEPDEYVAGMEEIRLALEQAPGVVSATYGLTLPLEMSGGGRCCWRTSLTTADESVEVAPQMHPVSQDYFSTLQIPLRAGRFWTEGEVGVSPIPALASETLAIQAFGSVDAATNQVLQSRSSTSYQIVGIVGDVRHYGLDADADPGLYLPVEQIPFGISRAHIAVRVRDGASEGLGRSLREAVWTAAPNLPVPIVRPMDEWMKLGSAERRFDAVIFGAFGVVALLLAAGGLYGTLLYVTGQRRREMAIRLALGASRGSIERWVLRGGVVLALVGIAVGLGGSWVATRLLESRLFGVERGDPLALIGAAALLLLTAVTASWWPARNAGRTNPLEMLNTE